MDNFVPTVSNNFYVWDTTRSFLSVAQIALSHSQIDHFGVGGSGRQPLHKDENRQTMANLCLDLACTKEEEKS